MWSNIGHTCLQRLNLTDRFPTARLSVTAGPGTTMNFDATGSNAPGGVAEFSWQFNDAFAAPTQQTATPMISHTFPEAGAYSVGLAVMSPSGFSAPAGGIVTTGHDGFTPGFTTSTSGQTVSFSALTRVIRKPVTNVMWEFGDGSTGSGLTPSHTYAAPGTYTVKAILFSGIGSAFPGDGAAPLAVEKVTVGG
jgi:PKD repeat protein